METFHGTTIVCVRRVTPEGVQVAIGGDGQVTLAVSLRTSCRNLNGLKAIV